MQTEGKKARGLTENMLSESNLSSLRLLNEWRSSVDSRWHKWR
jgi:L-glyceraldehyde 3-phosphate reductase